MTRTFNVLTWLAILPLAVFAAGALCFAAGPGALRQAGAEGLVLAQAGDDADDGPGSVSGPQYTEIEFTSLGGEIYVNPLYTGKITSVRTINESGLLGQKVDIEVRAMTGGWRKFSLPAAASGSYGVIVSGANGILKISRPGAPPPASSGELGTIKKVLIEFGYLNTTLTFPSQNVLEPDKYEIGILNTTDNGFINGNIIAMKSDQAAVEFIDLPGSVVDSSGNMRASLKKPGGTFFNSDIPAWGYNIIVPETDIGSPAPITAEVFGLPDDAEIRFDFSSLSGQVIDPSTKILTVGEINKGATVSTITTKIGGAQPLTVTVRRVK